MKDRQFEPFATEALNRGACAVLPQHLPDRWLNALLEEAELLQAGDRHERADTCAGLLGAVILLLSAQRGHPPVMEVAASTLLRSLEYYIITLSAELLSRQTDIWVAPPTLENIFHEERAMKAMRKSSGAPSARLYPRTGGEVSVAQKLLALATAEGNRSLRERGGQQKAWDAAAEESKPRPNALVTLSMWSWWCHTRSPHVW